MRTNSYAGGIYSFIVLPPLCSFVGFVKDRINVFFICGVRIAAGCFDRLGYFFNALSYASAVIIGVADLHIGTRGKRHIVAVRVLRTRRHGYSRCQD